MIMKVLQFIRTDDDDVVEQLIKLFVYAYTNVSLMMVKNYWEHLKHELITLKTIFLGYGTGTSEFAVFQMVRNLDPSQGPLYCIDCLICIFSKIWDESWKGVYILGIGSGVVRFLMIAEYATYRYLQCVVNVMIMQSILRHQIGIREIAYEWFSLFLCDKTMLVKVNESYSKVHALKSAVALGSVFCPVLFNIYIRSLYKFVECESFEIKGFADDHQMHASFSPTYQYQFFVSKLECIFASIDLWMSTFFLNN